MVFSRGSGILLHISSLPSRYGIGDLGPWAFRMADFFREAGQRYWQFLPIHPVDAAQSYSPYSSPSAFAGNPLLISPDGLVRDGLLRRSDLDHGTPLQKSRVDFEGARRLKQRLFDAAFERFTRCRSRDNYGLFCQAASNWLEDYALFAVAKRRFGGLPWQLWPPDVRDRLPAALAAVRKTSARDIEKEKFLQFVFFRQWSAFRSACLAAGIRFIGDMPLYVGHDSADVWANRELFRLDRHGHPTEVSGVPPDFFSRTGQLWGTPLYRWKVIKRNGFDWWVRRFEHLMNLFDIIRLDHIRGFVSFWSVPAREPTAVSGRWVKAPAAALFQTLEEHCGPLPVIAEDLGFITEEVRDVIHRFSMWGTRPLIFAFGGDLPHHFCAPHRLERNTVAYTGTHDTNTVRGWFEECPPEIRERFQRYLGRRISASDSSWEMMRAAARSVADIVIFPMQDILGLGSSARMNRPGTAVGNWRWRLSPGTLNGRRSEKLLCLTELYGRN